MGTTAIASSAVVLAAATVYAIVGWTFSRRKVSEPFQLAAYQFAAWWMGLAGLTGLGAIETILANLAPASLGASVAITLLYLELLVIVVALWGLVGYLLFVFRGRHSLVALSLFYAAEYIALLYLIVAAGPTGVDPSGAITFQHGFSSAVVVALVVVLIVPEILAVIAYATLFFRVTERVQRFRVAVVSSALLVWFGTSLVPAPGGSWGIVWDVLRSVLGMGAAVSTLAAYNPPAWVRTRFRLDVPVQASGGG